MSQTCADFQFMELMLEQIEKTKSSQSDKQQASAVDSLEDARKELQFKLQMGQSPVWTNILQLNDFLDKATA